MNRKKYSWLKAGTISAALLCGSGFMSTAQSAGAVNSKSESNFLTGVQNQTIPELLNHLRGKDITIFLSTGQSVHGKLSNENIDFSGAKAKLVHLTQLAEQESNDAVISLGSIVGIIVSVR